MLTILWNQIAIVPLGTGMAVGIQGDKKNQREKKRSEERTRKQKLQQDDVDLLEMCGMITKVL